MSQQRCELKSLPCSSAAQPACTPPGSRRAHPLSSHLLTCVPPLRCAAEALLAAALRNPRNQKFIILSESDLPLYSPEVLYLQVGGAASKLPARCVVLQRKHERQQPRWGCFNSVDAVRMRCLTVFSQLCVASRP